MRPLTDEVPKPLVPLNDKPIIQHLVEAYVRKGFHHFVLCIGYLGGMIKEFFDNHCFDAEFEYSDAGEDASMLQRLHHARGLMTEQVFVAYGDTYIDVDLEEMLASHPPSGALATITVANVRSPFGLVATDQGGWVTSFEEKPVHSYYVGHMLMRRSALEGLDPALLTMPDGQGLVELFCRLASQKRLRVHSYTGPQITFNTSHELRQAEREFIAFFTQQEGSRWP